MHTQFRRTAVTLASSVGLLVAGGLVGPPAHADADRTVRSAGSFSYVYNSSLVPAGATVAVHATYTGSGKTLVTLQVRGLAPHHEFGAHAHKVACGTAPPAAGGHYQHSATGGVNPENEIWLDFTTNDAGNGAAQATVDWQFTPTSRAASVVVHAYDSHTTIAPNPRVACRTVDF